MERPELKGKADLVIDATGVGPAVTDIFSKRGREFRAVKIHGGDAETRSDGIYRVPKRNLVSALQAALQTGALKIVAAELDLAPVLKEELLNFRIKVNIATAHDSYEAWPGRRPRRPGARGRSGRVGSPQAEAGDGL